MPRSPPTPATPRRSTCWGCCCCPAIRPARSRRSTRWSSTRRARFPPTCSWPGCTCCRAIRPWRCHARARRSATPEELRGARTVCADAAREQGIRPGRPGGAGAQSAAPGRAEGRIIAGLAAASRNDLPGATKLFEQALANDPESFEALRNLVRIDLATGKAGRAKDRVQAALARAPKNADPAHACRLPWRRSQGDTAADRAVAAAGDRERPHRARGLRRPRPALRFPEQAGRGAEGVRGRSPPSSRSRCRRTRWWRWRCTRRAG